VHASAPQLPSASGSGGHATLPQSPNLQAFVERAIQTLKHEVLNGFCVVNEKHLDRILRIGADWYNRRRGHSGRDHLPPVRENDDPPVIDLRKHKLVCHTELGGHLKSYRRGLTAWAS
jgi:putative transposase